MLHDQTYTLDCNTLRLAQSVKWVNDALDIQSAFMPMLTVQRLDPADTRRILTDTVELYAPDGTLAGSFDTTPYGTEGNPNAKGDNTIGVLRNTFAMSGISLLFSWFPMIFAVFLNEIKCRPYQKFVQTVTTLPNFISWVLVFSIAFNVFGSNGAVNSVLMDLKLIEKPISFLKSKDHLWFKMWLWLTWKNAGWAAIMYLAAITGIDTTLYEAAAVDGATKWQQVWHVTLPGIRPMIVILLIMSVGKIFNADFGLFYNVPQNSGPLYPVTQVIDTYVYNTYANTHNLGMSAAAGLLQSVVGCICIVITNGVVRKIDAESSLF
jgi:putative aldouronate transport system permease protein